MENKNSLRQTILIYQGLILAAFIPYLVRFSLSSSKWDVFLFITGKAGFSKQLSLVLPILGFIVLHIISLIRPLWILSFKEVIHKRWKVTLGVGIATMSLMFYAFTNIGLSPTTQLSYLLLFLWWLILFVTAIILPETWKPEKFTGRGVIAIFISFVLFIGLGVSYLLVGLNRIGINAYVAIEQPTPGIGINADMPTEQSTPRPAAPYPDPYYYGITNPVYYPFYIYSGERPAPFIESLQELASGAKTDQEVVNNVVDYFEENRDKISVDLGEENPERLKALYVMYLVHLAHPYGLEDHTPETLLDYIRGIEVAECFQINRYQAIIMNGFGLPWRRIGLSALHGWLEVKIDGQWEIFDATSNTWINHGAFELMEGGPRTYRLFYSPSMDENQEIARTFAQQLLDKRNFRYLPGTNKLIVLNGAGSAVLRAYMPGLGIYYPPKILCEGNESVCIPYVMEQSNTATP